MSGSIRQWFGVVLLFGALALGIVIADTADAGGKGDPAGANIVRVDLKKLPPGLAKQVRKYAEPANGSAKGAPKKGKGAEKGPPAKGADKKGKKEAGPSGKAFSLADAIGVAEKAGRGQAVKVERKGEGAASKFRVDVLGSDGRKTRVTVDAAGNVVGQPAAKGKAKAKGK